MALKTELTSADLVELRQTALGAADPLGLAAELAEAVESGRLADKDDAGTALTLAAEIAETRSRLDAALRYAEGAVEAFGTRDDSAAANARAVRARILFRSGRADEAMTEIEALRPRLTSDNDAPAYVSVALNVGGRNREAEQWLTEAVRTVLDERAAANQTADPASAEDAGLLFFLLQQRHRVRHALGLQHDAHDNLADRLETRLAGAAAAAEASDLLFWPRAEFDQVIKQWPALTEAYGESWDEHRARLERELVRRPAAALVAGTVSGLTGQAGADGDPADPQVRTAYARRLATGTERITWPPERNGSCWCGSGLKYKKCCLPRSRG